MCSKIGKASIKRRIENQLHLPWKGEERRQKRSGKERAEPPALILVAVHEEENRSRIFWHNKEKTWRPGKAPGEAAAERKKDD